MAKSKITIPKATIKKFDLRLLRENTPIKFEHIDNIISELNSYNIKVSHINYESQELTIHGLDSMNNEVSNIVKAREYLSEIRQVDKLSKKVERLRTRLDVESYKTKQINKLIFEDSVKLEAITGYKSYRRTLEKILEKDPETGLNKVEEAGKNLRTLRKLKHDAFNEQEDLIKKGVQDYRRSDYFDKDGNFKSRPAENRYYKLFAKSVTENFEEYENSFYGWLSDTHGTDVVKEFDNLDYEVKKELVQDYAKERIHVRLDSIGSQQWQEYLKSGGSQEKLDEIKAKLKKERKERYKRK